MKSRSRKYKEIVSVFGLLARSSFLKILGILAMLVVGESVLLWREVSVSYRNVLHGETLLGADEVMLLMAAPEKLLENAFVHMVFLAALALVMVVLIWTENRMSEKAGYTIMRLGLTRKELFVIKTVYNVACLVLLFVVQIWVAIGFLAWYEANMPLDISMPQLFFLAFYRNEFLHCILPMQEFGKWIRNFLMVAALSMTAAGVIVFPGEKGTRKSTSGWTIVILSVAWFLSDAGKNLQDMCCDILFVGVITWELLKIFGVFGRTEAAVSEQDT